LTVVRPHHGTSVITTLQVTFSTGWPSPSTGSLTAQVVLTVCEMHALSPGQPPGGCGTVHVPPPVQSPSTVQRRVRLFEHTMPKHGPTVLVGKFPFGQTGGLPGHLKTQVP
jgi:hypothetical protein